MRYFKRHWNVMELGSFPFNVWRVDKGLYEQWVQLMCRVAESIVFQSIGEKVHIDPAGSIPNGVTRQ